MMTRETLETVAYWLALARFPAHSVCVWREVNGKPAILRLSDQSAFREWSGCFSLFPAVPR